MFSGSKVEATKKLTLGKYALVESVLKEYKKTYFNNIGGAKRSVKDNGTVNIRRMTTKVNNVAKLLNFLVDKAPVEKQTTISKLLETIEVLGRDDGGYFAGDCKARYNTELTHFREFIGYLRIQNLITRDLFDRCEGILARMQWNLTTNQGVNRAQFQEDEKDKLVSPKDLKSFQDSDLCKKAQHLLQSKPKLLDVTMRDFTLVRNYLITSFIVEDMLRPCSLYRLPADQFIKPPPKPDSHGQYVYPLLYDKTVGATGKPHYLHLEGNWCT